MDNGTPFLLEKELVSYVLQLMLRLCLCKQADICVSFYLHVSLRKSTSEIELYLLGIFHLLELYLCKQRERHLYECLVIPVLVGEKTPIRTRIIGIFHFH